MSGLSGKKTILIHEFVTGGGLAGDDLPPTWAAEGAAMREAFVRDFAAIEEARVIMMLDERFAPASGNWETIPVGPGEELNLFESMVGECDVTLCVAPETDGILEERASIIERSGGRSLGSSARVIAVTADKWALEKTLRRMGVGCPRSRIVDPVYGLPVRFPYPGVLKPIDGAGSVNTFWIQNHQSVPTAAMGMGEALLQPVEAGQPWSASYLVGPGGRPCLIGVASQVMAIVDRKWQYLGGVAADPPEGLNLEPIERALSGIKGLRGWVGVDFMWSRSGSVPIVLDINPRVTTSYIGWRARLRDPSSIARRWLALFGEENCDASFVPDIANHTVAFNSDGNVTIENGHEFEVDPE